VGASARIRAWWASRACNIGISAGPSGLVVIDLDIAKAAGQPGGPESFCRLCRRYRQPVPRTFTVITPSGGRHLYFAARDGDVRNSAGRLAPLVDVRAAGGYVIGPAAASATAVTPSALPVARYRCRAG
jgi:hypothetical protein